MSRIGSFPRDLCTNSTGLELSVSSWFLSGSAAGAVVPTMVMLSPDKTRGFAPSAVQGQVTASWNAGLSVFEVPLNGCFASQHPSFVSVVTTFATASAFNSNLNLEVHSFRLDQENPMVRVGVFSGSTNTSTGLNSGSFTPNFPANFATGSLQVIAKQSTAR